MFKMSSEEVIMKQQMILVVSSSSESEREEGEDEEVVVDELPPPTWASVHQSSGITSLAGNRKRLLSKQLSMRETTREAKWEKRRRQITERRLMMEGGSEGRSSLGGVLGEEESDKEVVRDHMERMLIGRVRSLTDEDLDELRGSIELGFGFSEEEGGHRLCDTLPALDLYFAVNRQLSDPRLRGSSSPTSTQSSSFNLCGTSSPRSPTHDEGRHSVSSTDSWILNPGDNPQAVKMRLRHWAQAVACSVKQFS